MNTRISSKLAALAIALMMNSVIIGGVATIEGHFIGVLVLFVLQEQLATFGPIYLMLLGAIAIVVMVFFPKGLWGSFAERFDVRLFPVRRHLQINEPPRD